MLLGKFAGKRDRKPRRTFALTFAAVGVLCITSVAIASTWRGTNANGIRRPRVGAHQALGTTAQQSARAVAASFPALSRPRSASDGIPAPLVASLGSSFTAVGLDANASRLLVDNSAASIWLAPAVRGVCMIISPSGGGSAFIGCAPAGGNEPMLQAGRGMIAGVVPSGVTDVTAVMGSGTSVKLTPNATGAVAVGVQGALGSLAYTTADGRRVLLPAAPTPPPAPPPFAPTGS